jgi:hypothetical protein
MLFIDILVLFIFLERSTSRYIEQKRYALAIACESQLRSPTVDIAPGVVIDKSAFPDDDRFFLPKRAAWRRWTIFK